VQGGADVGQAILRERPDKVFFTGSSAVGRQILQAAAPDVTPVDLELGGKAPMIVFADAHLERAAAAAVWGAFVNAGQSCLHVERLYVEASAHDRLVTLIQTELSGLRVGTEPEADVGPVIGGFHAEHVEALVDDAIRQGARLGTERRHEGNLLAPLLLLGAHHGMRILREETFGPVLPVVAFPDGGEAEAIRLANDSSYGLNGYVFSSDLERARRVARALNVGNVGINDVIKNVANPDMPFGGVRGSGFGRYHGPEGLRAFTRPLALATHAGRRAREQNWFPTRPNTYSIVRSALSVFHGKRQRIRAAQRLVSALLSKTGDREKTGKP
jgi:acyl-CoA reductase-like NAD-dependent aldehyde dehydrogenase